MTRKEARSAIALGFVAIGLVAPSSASAETAQIGQTAPGGSAGACIGCTGLQPVTDPASPSYMVPSGTWTLTAWKIRGGATAAGNARLRVFRPTGVTDRYELIAETADEPVPAAVESTFAANIPVQGGDVLGMRTGPIVGDIASTYPGNLGDVNWQVLGDPALNQTVGTGGDFSAANNPGFRTNIAATLFRADPVVPPPDPKGKTKKKCKKPKKRASVAKKKCKKKKRRP
jgi:hypothetical protein